jgi:hypothetical protein
VKDCVERPRKKGAKYTNRDIAPDEIVTELDLTFDAKRDRWAGFDPSDYQRVVERTFLLLRLYFFSKEKLNERV